MDKHTWKATRWQKSYFVSVTPDEVICYVRDANDVTEQFEVPDQHVSRCSHIAFRAGELQDWVLIQMGDEVLMEVLTLIYDRGTSAAQIQRNDRTIQHWQMLPIDLMLVEDVRLPDDDGYSRFAMGRDGLTSAILPSGARLDVPLHSATGTLTLANGTSRHVTVPTKVMSVIPFEEHFYLSGERLQVIAETGNVTYESANEDEARYQLRSLFKTINLFRKGSKIIVEYQAADAIRSDVFELTGRKGYFSLHPTRGIISWQASR